MGSFCSTPVSEPVELDFEQGCYHCGAPDHHWRECREADSPHMICHDCGGDHLARLCPYRGTPELWQTVATVESNEHWWDVDGKWACKRRTAGWIMVARQPLWETAHTSVEANWGDEHWAGSSGHWRCQ